MQLKFMVNGSYQPAYMDSPSDERPSWHGKYEEAVKRAEDHIESGATEARIYLLVGEIKRRK